MKYFWITIISIFFGLTSSFSQDEFKPFKQNIIPPSAEASILGGAVEAPVDFYSGKASLSIPIVSVNYAGINLNVGLSYHGAGGIKVNQIPTSVGMGWTLNAGGAITRSVHGIPDDRKNGGFLDYSQLHSYEDFIDETDNTRWTMLDFVALGCGDTEPDIFFFNFNGYTGKFVYDWDGTIITDSKLKLKIDTICDSQKNIREWVVTDDHGIIYEFKAVEKTGMLNYGLVNCVGDWIPHNTAWYLTKIYNPNLSYANEINLEYEDYLQHQVQRFQTNLRYPKTNNSPTNGQGDKGHVNSTMIYNGKRISKIYTNDQEVAFHYDNIRTDLKNGEDPNGTLKSLDKISISSKLENVTRKIRDFNFAYHYNTGRLTLASITEINDSEAKKPYLFYYKGSLTNNYSSEAKDHWGYYNGSTRNNTWPIPSHIIPNSTVKYYGANRNVSSENVLSGMLEKIVFPTGGFTSFDYEVNQYSYIQNVHLQSIGEYVSVKKSYATNAAHGENLYPQTNGEYNVQTKFFTFNNPRVVTVLFGITKFSTFPSIKQPHAQIFKIESNGSESKIFEKSIEVIPSGATEGEGEESLSLAAGSYKLVAKAFHYGEDNNGVTGYDGAHIGVHYDSTIFDKPIIIKNGPGARIHRITKYAHQGDPNPQVTSFEYLMPDSSSSGVIYSEPRYDYITPFLIVENSVEEGAEDYMFHTGSLITLGSTQENSIGYRRVKVLHGENGKYGIEEYHYSSPFDHPVHIPDTLPFEPISPYGFKSGLLLEKKTYKNEENGFKLVSKEINDYNDWTHQFKAVHAIKIQSLGGNQTGEDYIWKYPIGTYDIILGHTQPTETKTFIYDEAADDSLFAITTSVYDNEKKYLKTVETLPFYSNEATRKDIFYPEDFTNPIPSVQKMLDLNILQEPIEVVSYKKDYTNTWAVTGAQYDMRRIENNKVFQDRINRLAINAPVKDFVSIADNNNSPDSRYYSVFTYDKYEGGFPIQTTAIDGVIRSNLRDSNGKIIVTCDNSIPEVLTYISFEENAPVVKGSYVQISNNFTTTTTTSFTGKNCASSGYFNGSFSPYIPQDYIMSFWGKAVWNQTGYVEVMDGNLTNIELTNQWKKYEVEFNQNTFDLTLFNGYVDEIRIHPKNAQMTTHSFDNLIGSTSINDFDGKPVNYEYDDLGRLRLTRDHEKNITQRITYEYDVVETFDPSKLHISHEIIGDYRYQFEVKNIAGNNLRYEWDFGDTRTAIIETDPTVTHAYPAVTMTYLVKVKIYDLNNDDKYVTTLQKEILITKSGGTEDDICSEISGISIVTYCNAINSNQLDFRVKKIFGASYKWYLNDVRQPHTTELFSNGFGCPLSSYNHKVRVEISFGGNKTCAVPKVTTTSANFCIPCQ